MSASGAAQGTKQPSESSLGMDIPLPSALSRAISIVYPTPKTLSLITANLKDSDSRHLMLLTQNSSALRLLFECGLLQAGSSSSSSASGNSNAASAEVLIGSKFQRDNNELRIIEHINAIKRTMARGGKAILVNHSSIYEALYDVLNQRYVTKVNSETGKTIRMLRLAIGNRSQLCEVAPGFKLIVIVEQHDAYEKLDLPLLNRFEKQVFGINDVLTPEGLLISGKVDEWCKSIIEETGIVNPFVGFHAGTVPSLIFTLYRSGKLIDKTGDEAVEIAKKLMLQIATPLTLFSSKKARDCLPEGQTSFEGVLKNITDGHTGNAVILTNSLCRDLNTSWLNELNTNFLSKSGNDVYVEMIVLAELSSERDLVLATRAFLTNLKVKVASDTSNKHSGILVIQCDPLATDQQLIDHARWLCMREWPKQSSEPSQTPSPFSQIPSLVFVVHVPPRFDIISTSAAACDVSLLVPESGRDFLTIASESTMFLDSANACQISGKRFKRRTLKLQSNSRNTRANARITRVSIAILSDSRRLPDMHSPVETILTWQCASPF